MKLNIFGWRNLSHSFALVNQHQLSSLMKNRSLTLSHEDAPYFSQAWTTLTCGSGFGDIHQTAINAIPPKDDLAVDWTYEIAFPFFAFQHRSKEPVAHFMVTNYGVTKRDFLHNSPLSSLEFEDKDLIITPTQWSREKICRYGFPEDRVRVVHHGVDLNIFQPLTDENRRAARQMLGVKEDQFCFLNIGALSANKGLDILIKAFAKVAMSHPNVRLLIKDQNYLYGAKAQNVVQSIFNAMPSNEANLVASKSISLSSNLTVEQLRVLYGASDCYVSPYRAEGFNLPVLEAMACGLPVLVTHGGATDDFVFSADSKIASKKMPNSELFRLGVNDERLEIDSHFLEPEFDSLVEIMMTAVSNRKSSNSIDPTISNFSWDKVTEDLISTLLDN
jgi:glycosyltransferase involved in cell wall biosynthesis